jgi:casein kinase 1
MGRTSGSSRRAVVSGSRELSSATVLTDDLSRTRGTDASPGTFRKVSGPQRGSPPMLGAPASSEPPKRSSSGRHIKTYESTLKGIEGLNFDGDERLHY